MPAQLPLRDDHKELPERFFDAVAIGAGVAGLTFALHFPADRKLLLITKGELGESNTRYAQGGISAAIGEDDSPRLHETDTLAAGAGLCDPDAVRALVDGAPQAVEWLVNIGAQFDRDAGGAILLGREAAHSRRRVLHAGGDATGHEVERALVAEAKRRDNIEVWPHAFAIDLALAADSIAGAYVEDADGIRWRCRAPVTVVAAGGAGQIWEVTSNPPGATADGLAMALRAGAAVADCEFVQFHPTVLALSGWDAFLVSEAVRGEGAYLRDSGGRRFMLDEHPLAELAPRDVVARGIHRQLAAGNGAFLDVRHLDAGSIRDRFPTIARELAQRGLDLATDPIPVSPAAHYFMGGIVATTEGITSLPGLLALGEASCTGIHGANRLASNSLLEGLVFGRLAAERAAIDYPATSETAVSTPRTAAVNSPGERDPELTARLRTRVKQIMSEHVGVDRDRAGLETAVAELAEIAAESTGLGASRDETAATNLIHAAQAIAGAALNRQESRGAHYRSDFPAIDPRLDGQHSILPRGDEPWTFGALLDAIDRSGGEGGSAPSPAYARALRRFYDRSDYDKGIITNPFGVDDAAGERGLARTRGLVERLGDPLARVPVVHVAGSKGKGSTTAFISNILTAQGLRTGRYTSPHLHSLRERIAVDDEPISETDFANAFERALTAAEALEAEKPELGRVTAFELITAAAFAHFAATECDIAVIETGLGGRWDATNIVDPLVSVITLIDLEHTDVLGDTLVKIASEKAGIIKPGRPVVTSGQAPEVVELFRAVCAERGASFSIEGVDWSVNDDWNAAIIRLKKESFGPLRLGLRGPHQVRNAGLAVAAVKLIETYAVSAAAIAAGLVNTRLPARLEIVREAGRPDIVIDGAHTPASARALVESIRAEYPDVTRVAIVFGMLRGKDLDGVLGELTRLGDTIALVAPRSPRATGRGELSRAARASGFTSTLHSSIERALDFAGNPEAAPALIVVTGSLMLAAEAREALGLDATERIPMEPRKQ